MFFRVQFKVLYFLHAYKNTKIYLLSFLCRWYSTVYAGWTKWLKILMPYLTLCLMCRWIRWFRNASSTKKYCIFKFQKFSSVYSWYRKGITVTHPTVMSKMLLPTELDTAMSPRPFRATITLVIRSGMDVPAARMVRPMISSEIPTVSPTCNKKGWKHVSDRVKTSHCWTVGYMKSEMSHPESVTPDHIVSVAELHQLFVFFFAWLVILPIYYISVPPPAHHVNSFFDKKVIHEFIVIEYS